MIPASFDYELAESVDHALDLLGADSEAKVLAGGHSLVPALKLRLVRPSKLVDVARLSSLSYVRDAGAHLAIGALTRHKDVRDDPLLRDQCPIVSSAAGLVGDPQVRHRGTIGGSLAHGDPASDLPAVMLALGAELVLRDAGGERVVPAASFFAGVFETAASAPGTLLVEVRVPKLDASSGWSYLAFRRRAQDWATVGVAALVERANGAVSGATIALAGVAGTPVRAVVSEGALVGGATVAEAAREAAEGLEPPADTSASSEFRAHLARVLTRRALEQAMS